MPFSWQELFCLSTNPGLFMTSKKLGSSLDAQHITKLKPSEQAFKSSHDQTCKTENKQKDSVLLLLFVLPSQIPFHTTKQTEQALLEQDVTADESGRLSSTICASWYQDELMASERLGVTHICLLWHDSYWERKELKGSSHCRTLSKRKTNSFLTPNPFFYSSAFLLTSRHPKLGAGWDHVGDLNLSATTWVNSFAVPTQSGLNFSQVQQSSLRKQIYQTLDINLGCNSSTINESQDGKKWQILLSQTRLRLHGLQREKLPIS